MSPTTSMRHGMGGVRSAEESFPRKIKFPKAFISGRRSRNVTDAGCACAARADFLWDTHI